MLDMKIFKNGKLVGKQTKAGEWGTSKVKLGKDDRVTFSSESKGETSMLISYYVIT